MAAAKAEILSHYAADRIAHIFDQNGESDYIGEPLSIIEHSWQAFECARIAGASQHVQVASLLHDIGHMLGMEAGFDVDMEGCGMLDHEKLGAEFLRSLGFHDHVVWLVANHVNAKRFLVWRDKGYYERLSDASKTTLRFQGGPMDCEDAAQFMTHSGYEEVLDLRRFDEAAKEPGKGLPSIDSIKKIVHNHVLTTLSSNDSKVAQDLFPTSAHILSAAQRRFFRENGYLLIKQHPLTARQLDLDGMSQHLTSKAISAPLPHWFVHHEEVQTEDRKSHRVQLCRVENFSQDTPDWKAVADLAQDICGDLFQEPAVLFKDKLNMKLPGGGGFKPHQDVTAYKKDQFASIHISALVAIDPVHDCSLGPLELARGRHLEGVFVNEKGVIVDAERFEFKPVYLDRGDMIFFCSFIPHRSETNESDRSRRIAYLTYNKLSEGNFKEMYYAAKLAVFEAGTGGTISVNDDFAGKIVS